LGNKLEHDFERIVLENAVLSRIGIEIGRAAL
jgi:hypothetical protein